MKEVIVASRSPMEMIIEAFIEHWPTDFVPRTHCRKMVALVGATNKILPENVDGVFRHVWKQQATAADRNSTVMRVAGVGHRFGVVGAVVNKKLNTAHPDWEVTMKALESYDETAMLGQVLDSLSEQGLEV
jgi:predicted oxidoreductase (fatty acid repression mutant protein)